MFEELVVCIAPVPPVISNLATELALAGKLPTLWKCRGKRGMTGQPDWRINGQHNDSP
jgi:hypothetical protein